MDKIIRENITLGGCVSAPVSKSVAHRMLICAALSDKECIIHCRSTNDDIDATVNCLTELGAEITYKNGIYRVRPIRCVNKGKTLFCRESGSTLRFLLPVAAALSADSVFTGAGRLPNRPLSPLYELMCEKGVQMSGNGSMPLVCRGRLCGNHFSIDGGVSSQFITGLLLASPLMDCKVTIEITGKIESAPYIDITISCLENFGVKALRVGNIITVEGKYSSPCELSVEGDWSSAAFWLTAGVLSSESISVKNLSEKSSQGDRKVVDCLRALGAHITYDSESFTSHPSSLKGCTLDCADIPDLVPILSVAAAFADGETVFENISRLRAKESDRVAAVCTMLNNFSIETSANENTLTVKGGKPFGKYVDSFSDHRIAMSGAVLAVSSGCSCTVNNAECVSKSYPDFFNDLEMLCKK